MGTVILCAALCIVYCDSGLDRETRQRFSSSSALYWDHQVILSEEALTPPLRRSGSARPTHILLDDGREFLETWRERRDGIPISEF